MAASRKPLHSYEQSMLLVAMLFDGKTIDQILSFLPDQQQERIEKAKEKFLRLSRNERMTEIVFELRRLLLIDEYPIDWIHQSWIDDALSKEPAYLKPIIERAIIQGSQRKTLREHSVVPLPFIFSVFIAQLSKSPQKTAIFDPVLMRLQSLKDEAHDEVFLDIGTHSLALLGNTLDTARFARFLCRKGFLSSLPTIPANGHIFESQNMRRYYLKELFQNHQPPINLALFAGLLTTALYLVPFKYHWQRTITLLLPLRLGRMLEDMICRSKHHEINNEAHEKLASLMNIASSKR
jgi:hypothetical protein